MPLSYLSGKVSYAWVNSYPSRLGRTRPRNRRGHEGACVRRSRYTGSEDPKGGINMVSGRWAVDLRPETST